MRARLINNLVWVIPGLPCAVFWYTWWHYSTRRWAEYLLIPAMLLSVLAGLFTLAYVWRLRRSGAIRLRDPRVVTGLVLAALDVAVPVGITVVVLALLALIGDDFKIMP